MKKILLMFLMFLIFFIVIYAIPLSVLSADPPAKHPKTSDPLVIDCLKGTPRNIDGKLDDWQLSYMIPAVLDTEEQIFLGQANWSNSKDCSGKFYVMWDEKNIYIGVEVKDDKLSMGKAGGDIWNADAIEIFFSTTNAVAGHNEHYQYGFNAKNQKWNWCNIDGAGSKEPDYLKVMSTEIAGGYICEASIDYKQMKSLKFEKGSAIGFHPVIDDTEAVDREIQMTWTGREAHDQSMGFGHIILSSQAASVNPNEKMALTWGMIKK